MSEASAEGGAFSGNFMFVGNVANDGKSGKQIRSHLMREYYRKERWKKCLTHRQHSGFDWPPKTEDQDSSPTPALSRPTSKKDGKKPGSWQKGPKKTKFDAKSSIPASQATSSVSSRTDAVTSPGAIHSSYPAAQTSIPPLATRPDLPETLPEPLFCPPSPKQSNDLSSSSEIAFSSYSPGGTWTSEEEPNLERPSTVGHARRKMRTLVEDFYNRRPALCGSPGSELYVDPFGYLPIKLNSTDHSVLQYYVRMPELVYNIEPNAMHALHKTVFLPISFVYPESLYLCLASASLHLSQRYGQTDRSLTNFYKMRAYARIQANMKNDESRYGDAVVAGLSGSAVIALGASPEQGNFMEFQTHMMGLAHVLRMRGGQQSLRTNPRLDLGYSSIILLIGKTWSDTLGKIIPPGFEEYAKADVRDYRHNCSMLTEWLRQASSWTRSLAGHSSTGKYLTPKQIETFRQDKTLYKVLHWPLALNNAAAPKRVMFERSHHTFSLVYLALSLWQLRDQPAAKDHFLDLLADGLEHNNIRKTYTTVALAWMLLQVYSHQPERTWLTLALSKVIWRLGLENFETLKTYLLYILCPTPGDVPVFTEDMIQEIERDALRDLPTR